MEGITNLETVTVTVPGGRAGDVIEFAASLFKSRSETADTGDVEQNVQLAFLGGESDAWRSFLRFLTGHPDEWVAWPDACEAIGMDRKRASGMLGAAHHRLSKLDFIPYERRHVGGDTDFRMTREVADIIKRLDEKEDAR